ncbi:MAG: YopX family protein [Mariniphaga sp.]
MQREILFRAYDPDDNEMYYPSVISFVDGKAMPLRICKDGNRAYKSHKLMQFTGLTDKNGVKIFVGDILHFTQHQKYMMSSCRMEVCFDTEMGCFGYKSKTNVCDDYIMPFCQHDELHDDLLNHCEVIGNIHNNKDLL